MFVCFGNQRSVINLAITWKHSFLILVLLPLAILGDTTQIGMVPFVSCHPRWPITWRVGMKLVIFSPKQLCQCKWGIRRTEETKVCNGKTVRFKIIDILTTKTGLFRKKREWETNWRLGLNVTKLFFLC